MTWVEAKESDAWMMKLVLQHSTFAQDDYQTCWLQVPPNLSKDMVSNTGVINADFFKDVDTKKIVPDWHPQWKTVVYSAHLVKNIKKEWCGD